MAADVAHGVGGTGAAQHTPARLVPLAPQQPRLRHGLQKLRHPGRAGQQPQARRALHHQALVVRAGFEQGHLHLGVFGQAGGQHRAGRASAHNHIVHVQVHDGPPFLVGA